MFDVQIANVKQQRVHNEMTHMLAFHNCLLRAGCTKIFWVQVDTIGNGNAQCTSFCICHKYVKFERNTFFFVCCDNITHRSMMTQTRSLPDEDAFVAAADEKCTASFYSCVEDPNVRACSTHAPRLLR